MNEGEPPNQCHVNVGNSDSEGAMTTDDFFDQINRPLGHGMPEEAAGVAPLGTPVGAIGTVRGVNDRWASLVEGFHPTQHELLSLIHI